MVRGGGGMSYHVRLFRSFRLVMLVISGHHGLVVALVEVVKNIPERVAGGRGVYL